MPLARMLLLLATLTLPGPSAAGVPTPEVEGPVSGGLGEPFVAATTFDLAEVGYEQAEYFVSGTARAFEPLAPLGSDGEWDVAPGAEAAYRTRILVYRPMHRRDFSGTVVVEWLNVSGGLDAAPDWLLAHTELLREGHAWVGVSAQQVGVSGGPSLPGIPPMPLTLLDPERYGSLDHPGDSFSYDIFAQVGQLLRHPPGLDPLAGLRARRILAIGESQSAFRLTTYVNAIHPLARIYDGFLIHSRGGSSADLSQPPQVAAPAPLSVRHRTDLRVPVLVVQTETDMTLLGYVRDRQPDSAYFRLWEAAGTAHADAYITLQAAADLGNSPEVAELIITTTPVPQLPVLECPFPINSGPHHFVVKAAFAALERWVRTGRAPEPAPRLEIREGPPFVIQRDSLGNALGGIRGPAVDVPLATLSGEGQIGSIFCILFGTTVPFDAATLERLYPDACEYLERSDRATDRAVRRGHLLEADAELIRRAARRSPPALGAEDCPKPRKAKKRKAKKRKKAAKKQSKKSRKTKKQKK